jgi:hypothetical protein
MICPRCGLAELDEDGTIQTCYKCSYWNDTLRPLHTKKEQKKIDALDKERLRAEVAILLKKEGKGKSNDDAEKAMAREKYREKDREYKRNWARKNAASINASRRERQAKLIVEARG